MLRLPISLYLRLPRSKNCFIFQISTDENVRWYVFEVILPLWVRK